jgi:hypothetical protein
MNRKLVYVGLAVDDTQYHGSALNEKNRGIPEFSMPANPEGFVGPTR